MRTDREAWADIAKGIGILLVVFGHVWRGVYNADLLGAQPLFEAVDRGIYLFHMPLFFFVAGAFFNANTSMGAFFVRSGERILYPLVLWSYLLAFSLLIAQDFTNRGETSLVETIRYPFPPKDIFWFLWALFLIQTAAYACLKLPEPARLPTIACLLGACMLIASSGEQGEILAGAAYHLVFFVLGLAFRRGTASPSVGLIPVFVGIAVFLLVQGTLLAADGPRSYLSQVGLASAALVGVIVVVHGLSQRFAQSPILQGCALIGALSLPIYVAHTFFLAGARIVLLAFGNDDLVTHVVLGTVAGVAGPLVLYAAARRIHLDRALGFGAVRLAPEPTPAHAHAGRPQ